tara:strand:- start:308 stop:1249 length:942 start_codon:yes stop_codon:yes gene_type:complete
MKFKIIDNEPLQFYNSAGELTGTIQISSSGDMFIRPESGSSRDITIGDPDVASDVEVGLASAPIDFTMLGGGTITSNGNTLNIGSTTNGDTVNLYNVVYSQSLAVTGSVNVTGSVTATSFVGDGSQLTGLISSSYAITASHALNAGGDSSTFPFTGVATITGSLIVSASSHIDLAIQTGSSATSFESTKVFGEQILSNNNADFTFFEDQYIKMSIDESANDVDVEVLQNPSSGRVHFFSMCSDGTDAAVDGLTSTTPTILETNLGNDTQALISVNAPDDTTWPIYKFDVIRTNSTYYTKRYIVHIKKMQNPYS